MNFDAVVHVKDLERAVDFHARVAGLSVVRRETIFALPGAAPLQLVIHRIAAKSTTPNANGASRPARSAMDTIPSSMSSSCVKSNPDPARRRTSRTNSRDAR